MLPLPAAAAVNFLQKSQERLLNKVAPGFDFMPILEVLPQEISNISLEELSERLAEFLKFIYLRSLFPSEDVFVPVKKSIDEIWHSFIVQTRFYKNLCQALPNKNFLHHTTVHLSDFGARHDSALITQQMLSWIPKYHQHFGPFTLKSASYWLMPSYLMEKMGMSLSDVNALTN